VPPGIEPRPSAHAGPNNAEPSADADNPSTHDAKPNASADDPSTHDPGTDTTVPAGPDALGKLLKLV